MSTKARLTLDEFLELPETEPASEFAHGEIVERMAPSFIHAYLVAELTVRLHDYLRTTGEGFAVPEARHANRPEQRAYLPDVEVITTGRLPRDRRTLRHGPLETPPDIAIEVLSPGDRPAQVAEKVEFYLRTGVRLVWVVDPEHETLTVHRPGVPPSTHHAGERIDAAPVLRGFELDLSTLFTVPGEAEQ